MHGCLQLKQGRSGVGTCTKEVSMQVPAPTSESMKGPSVLGFLCHSIHDLLITNNSCAN